MLFRSVVKASSTVSKAKEMMVIVPAKGAISDKTLAAPVKASTTTVSKAKETTVTVAANGAIAVKPPAAPPIRQTCSRAPKCAETTDTAPADVKTKATNTVKGNKNGKRGKKVPVDPA